MSEALEKAAKAAEAACPWPLGAPGPICSDPHEVARAAITAFLSEVGEDELATMLNHVPMRDLGDGDFCQDSDACAKATVAFLMRKVTDKDV